MAAITYGVTDKGFVTKPLDAIVSAINARFVAAFGSTFDVSPESPDGQVIGIVADEVSSCWDQAQHGFNAYRPGSMEGVGLDNICELTGAVRYVNKPSSVTVVCSGSSGTVVPAGSLVGDGTNTFATQTDVTIPGDATALCTTVGEIYVGPSTVTKIITTGITGWTGVTNPEEGVTGINYEQDTSLRARRDKTTVSNGTSTTEAIYSALADLDLDYIRIRDNDTPDAIGSQPGNTIYLVVDGGTENDIGRRLFDNKTAAVPTYGSISVVVKDSKGYPHTVKFSRTSKVPVFFDIKVKRLPNANLSSNDVEMAVQDAVMDYITSLQPGAPVVWSYIIPPILASTTGIQIDDLKVGLSAATVANTTLDMEIDQRASTAIANIKVTDTTNNP